MAAAFDEQAEAFFARYFDFHPTVAAEAGLHDYDALLGRRDRESVESYLRELARLERTLAAFPEERLGEEQRADRRLLLRQVRSERFWLEEAERWHKDPRYYADGMDMTLLLLLDYAPPAERMEALVARLERFPERIVAARRNVGSPPAPFVESALLVYRGWPGFLERELTAALEGVGSEALQTRFRRARDRAAAEIRAYVEELEALEPAADGSWRLGPERYRRMLAVHSDVELPLEELRALGERELERLRGEAASLAEEIAPGRGVEAALARLGEDRLDPEDLVGAASTVLEELREFVESRRVGTTLPGRVSVRPSPPFARTNFAYIWIPGPFEAPGAEGFYFLQPVEPEWAPEVRREFLETNNRWSVLNTSGHESYPGHYHHFTHLHRAPTRARRLLKANVTLEGWAHYAEEMAWREGLRGRDPRLGLAVVRDGLLRVVRFLVSIGLHANGTSVSEAEARFRREAYQDPVSARLQALRGTYDPEYLDYTLGKLMLRRLRGEMERRARERGEPFDLRTFHDDFMADGAPPIPWIGQRMTGDAGWTPFE